MPKAGISTVDGRKAVLVTGASSGIGRKVTEHLAAAGHFVYAGFRRECDGAALGTIDNVYPLVLDVTEPRTLEAAVQTVTAGGHGLHGLVNNAGVATLGSVTDTSEKEFELVMAVNVQGPYRVTAMFAPQIIASCGRIVMMGSISGILAEGGVSAYSMSKHAVEALADALALEMSPHGVRVSVVEPSNFNTRIAQNAIRRLGKDPGLPDLCAYNEPDKVAEAVTHALFAPRPKRRYLVVSKDEEARMTIVKQLEQLVQLNENHAFTYDRDALVEMLDAALAQTSAR